MATERPVHPEVVRVAPKPAPGVTAKPAGAQVPVEPKKRGKLLKKVGIGVLAGLGAVAGWKLARHLAGTSEDQLARKHLLDYMREQTQNNIDSSANYARSMSYQDSIDRNLANVQQYAPDLYMKVAAGRALPQGAVVLGGSPRQDLLQELGRAMADGRFNR